MEKMLALGVVLSAADKFSPVFGKAQKDLSELEKKTKALGSGLAKLGTASLALGTAITTPLGAALNSYQDLAKAQGEIASLGIGDKGINAITKSAMQFSNQFAGTTAPDFVKASYDIKSGISSLSDTAVGEFTKLAAMTGAATKSSTGEMTSLFASGFGIYRQQFESFGASTIAGWNKLSAEEKDVKFGEYFSAGISSAVQAFKTDGANMSAAISNLGAAATSANVPFGEQLSILGMLQKTMSGSEAATKYRAFLSSATAASDKLGLSFTDSNNQLLSMPEIIGQLKDKYGETIDALESDELKKAFGTEEAVALVKLLYGETDTLTSSIKEMGTSLQSGTTKTEAMAKAMNKGKEFELLSQKMGNLSSLIGQTFAPVALKLGNVIGDVVSKAQTWMNENEELAGTIGTVIAVAGGILTVLGSVAISVGAVTMALPALATALAVTKVAFLGLGTAILKVGAMFLANPIGIVAVAIAGAAYAIYSNWGTIKEFFSNMWAGIKESFSTAWTFIKKIFSYSPLGIVMENYGKIFDWLASKFEWFGTAVSKIKGIGSSIKSFFGFGDDNKDVQVKQNEIKPKINSIQSNMNYTQMPKLNTPGGKGVNQNNNIQVTVNNPSSNVDVQKAVVNAMANNRGLSDENL